MFRMLSCLGCNPVQDANILALNFKGAYIIVLYSQGYFGMQTPCTEKLNQLKSLFWGVEHAKHKVGAYIYRKCSYSPSYAGSVSCFFILQREVRGPMTDLAGDANWARTTASATMHTQGRSSFAKPLIV